MGPLHGSIRAVLCTWFEASTAHFYISSVQECERRSHLNSVPWSEKWKKMRSELYSQNTHGPHKVLQIGLCLYLHILCPNIVLFIAFVLEINVTQRKISSGYWLRHKVAKITEQVCCWFVELNVITFTWLNFFSRLWVWWWLWSVLKNQNAPESENKIWGFQDEWMFSSPGISEDCHKAYCSLCRSSLLIAHL